MLVLQNVLYCLLFLLMVKCLARDNGKNCMYFTPKRSLKKQTGAA